MEAVPLQNGGGGEDAFAGKADDRIVRPEVPVAPALPRIAQGREPLVPHHVVGVAKALDQPLDKRQRLRGHTDVHHLRIHQTDGAQPRRAAIPVRDQLRLVDDRGFEMSAKIAQLDRGGDDLRALHRDRFLPGQHAAGDARVVELVEHLQRQQAQRAEVGARRVGLQILDGVKSLAAVGGADVQDEHPLQPLCPLDQGFRREGGVELHDLADLPLPLCLFVPLFEQFLDLRMLDRPRRHVLGPALHRPPGSAAAADAHDLRLGKVHLDVLFCDIVFFDDLLPGEKLPRFLPALCHRPFPCMISCYEQHTTSGRFLQGKRPTAEPPLRENNAALELYKTKSVCYIILEMILFSPLCRS